MQCHRVNRQWKPWAREKGGKVEKRTQRWQVLWAFFASIFTDNICLHASQVAAPIATIWERQKLSLNENTKLKWTADTLEYRAVIQKNVEKLEKWAGRKVQWKFNKRKCNAFIWLLLSLFCWKPQVNLHQEWSNPIHSAGWMPTEWNQLCRKGSESPGTQQAEIEPAVWQRPNACYCSGLSCIRKNYPTRTEKYIFSIEKMEQRCSLRCSEKIRDSRYKLWWGKFWTDISENLFKGKGTHVGTGNPGKLWNGYLWIYSALEWAKCWATWCKFYVCLGLWESLNQMTSSYLWLKKTKKQSNQKT